MYKIVLLSSSLLHRLFICCFQSKNPNCNNVKVRAIISWNIYNHTVKEQILRLFSSGQSMCTELNQFIIILKMNQFILTWFKHCRITHVCFVVQTTTVLWWNLIFLALGKDTIVSCAQAGLSTSVTWSQRQKYNFEPKKNIIFTNKSLNTYGHGRVKKKKEILEHFCHLLTLRNERGVDSKEIFLNENEKSASNF